MNGCEACGESGPFGRSADYCELCDGVESIKERKMNDSTIRFMMFLYFLFLLVVIGLLVIVPTGAKADGTNGGNVNSTASVTVEEVITCNELECTSSNSAETGEPIEVRQGEWVY